MQARAGLFCILGLNLLALALLVGALQVRAEHRAALATAACAALLLCSLAAWLQARRAGRRYALLVGDMQALGAGRLTLAPRADEAGRALAVCSERMADVVARVRNGTAGFAMTSGLLSNDNKALLQRTDRQGALLQQTAAATGQITTNVRHNADNADKADRLIASAAQAAARGGEVVAGVERDMAGIRDSSRRIADIIGVIDGIAFQTNILALNAAVEAARAGVTGRGFAVVAAEVRVLAQRVASASREIQLLIGDSVGKVESCDRQVLLAGEAMRSIVCSVGSAAAIMGDISHASREQSAGVASINDTIAQLDRMTQENARLTDEIAAAAGNLYRQAVTLTDVVSHFELGSGEFGSREDALRLVDAAAGFVDDAGMQALAQEVNDTIARRFADRDLYLVVVEIATGRIVAHGGNPRLVGVDTRQQRDPEGKPFGRQIVDVARDQGSGWIDFKFAHPVTQEVRAKSAYVRRVGDCLLSCGFYSQ